ncbi:uncharacterized protein LOC112177676 [Rosa chinensis]|uniref:uncharacterized protein LOC112177676 n=1 Tax=Rosa chinensis TaxID=74649 RepID=UPI000D08E94A|nr:uncharacterized protein LOC112177676 [Rosa chinensis]
MTLWKLETQLRLDRAVGTATWSDIFGFSRVKHLSPSDSDHTLIVLQARTIPLPKRPRRHRFKFESFWLQHEEYDPLVLSNWQTEFIGVPMYTLTRKIMCTRRALEGWQQSTFRFRQQQMFEIRGRLEYLMSESLTSEYHEEKKVLMASLQQLFLRKKRFGSKGLKLPEGRWRDDDEGMDTVVTSYFSKMFTATSLDVEAIDLTLDAIQPCVTIVMNQKLCAPYTEEEVRVALFQMYPTKSHGPDGMPPLFFLHYWETIRVDVTEAVQIILPDIISPFQSAFVPGRLITDNILVANEVAHFVHNKREGQDGYMALKLDLRKAYDRMEWEFLPKVMPRGYVIPSRGLRQGDPLSPYLFLLGAEGFSALLQKKQQMESLPGIAICQTAPLVNHLLFVDDSMLFAHATSEACFQIQEIIDVYGTASGQVVNFHKSSVAFSKNVREVDQEVMANLLGVVIVESHERYLGLPTFMG